MKKKALKKIGIALAGISTVFAGSTFAIGTKPSYSEAGEKPSARQSKGNSGEGPAHGAMVETRGGLTVLDPCSNWYWFNIGGRLEFDEIIMSGNHRDRQGNFVSSANLRRAFLAFTGGIGECLSYNLTVDFGRTHSFWAQEGNDVLVPPFSTRPGVLDPAGPLAHGVVIIEDAWLGYSGLWDCTCIRFGQFTPLASLDAADNYEITNAQIFLESALATRAFDVPSYIETDSRAMKGFGVILNTQLCDLFTFGATVYQPAHGPRNVYGDPRRSDRVGGAVRLTFSPIHECDRAVHAGFLARYQSLNSTDGSQAINPGSDAIINTLFFTTPEVTPRNYIGNPAVLSAQVNNGAPLTGAADANFDPNIVNTGAIRARSYNHLIGELAGVWGPFTASGEYHYTNVQRLPFSSATNQRGSLHFYGWHAQASYVLTGESRGYDFCRGTIGTLVPCSTCGAWEIAARYSYVNLMNKDLYGGASNDITLGLNWYVNENVRFAFNYIRAEITPTGIVAGQQPLPSQAAKRKLDIMAARVQVVF